MTVSRIVRKALLAFALLVLLVPAILLASGALPYRLYVIHTGSMSPTIPSRSAVVVREGTYRLGQVITYRTSNGVVTHRFIKRNANGELATKGDANRTEDPSAISRAQVIGGVVAAPRMVGYWIVYFKQPAGLASLFLAVVCAWLVYSLPTDFAKLRAPRERRVRSRRATLPIKVSSTDTSKRYPSTTVERLTADTQEGPMFLCSGCHAKFQSADELRAHLARYPREETPVPARDPQWGFPVEFLPGSSWQKAT
jgi:signal peptidase